MQPRLHIRLWLQACILGATLLFLYWLYGWRPFLVQAWSAVDDGLYINHAESILKWLNGECQEWLGPFHAHLLSKSPLCGMWFALINILGIPLRVAEFLLMVAGAFLFKHSVRPVKNLTWWEFLVVLFLLLANPLLPEQYTLTRETLQLILTNLCMIATMGFALRIRASLGTRMKWALLTGLFFGLCQLNREESLWLAVPIGMAFTFSVVDGFFHVNRGQLTRKSFFMAQILIIAVIVGGASPVSLAIRALNKKYYGAFITSFRQSNDFRTLFHRLTSLEPEERAAYVPIARPTRLKAYQLSPTFTRMESFLEEPGSYWSAGNEHSELNGRLRKDREFFISYFEFSLLFAGYQAGAKTAGEMEKMFTVIATELDDAVHTGKIQAGLPGPALLAGMRPGDIGRILSATWQSFYKLVAVKMRNYTWPEQATTDENRMREVSLLVHSSVDVYPKPNILYSTRAPIFLAIKQLQRLLYPALLLAIPVLCAWRRREIFTPNPTLRGLYISFLTIPLSGLIAFCLAMGVVDTLGFHFLHVMAYNLLGFGPMSLVCAFSFVGLRLSTSPSKQINNSVCH